MQIKRSVLLFPLLCVGCGGGGQPEAADYFHEDTFAVVHINSSAMQESSLWEERMEQREFEGAWEEMNEVFKDKFGFTPDVVESATFAFSAPGGNRGDILTFVSTNQALELDKLGPASGRRVAYDDGGGYGRMSHLRHEATETGDYTLRLSIVGNRDFSGTVEGSMGEETISLSSASAKETIGPFRVNEGELIDVRTEGEGDPVLELVVNSAPTEVDGTMVYPFQSGGASCELEDELYVFAERNDYLTEMLSDEADERELDEDVQALFDQADWSADLMAAVSLDEIPREDIDEIESALEEGQGISARHARAVRDVSGVLVSLRLGSDEIELVCELICEDSDATEDVLELVEDLLGAIEDEREIPGDLRDLIEDIEVDTSGETVELTLVIDQETIEDLPEIVASG